MSIIEDAVADAPTLVHEGLAMVPVDAVDAISVGLALRLSILHSTGAINADVVNFVAGLLTKYVDLTDAVRLKHAMELLGDSVPDSPAELTED